MNLKTNNIDKSISTKSKFDFDTSKNYLYEMGENLVLDNIYVSTLSREEDRTAYPPEKYISSAVFLSTGEDSSKLTEQFTDFKQIADRNKGTYLFLYPYPKISYSESDSINFLNHFASPDKDSIFQEAQIRINDKERLSINSYEEFRNFMNEKEEKAKNKKVRARY